MIPFSAVQNFGEVFCPTENGTFRLIYNGQGIYALEFPGGQRRIASATGMTKSPFRSHPDYVHKALSLLNDYFLGTKVSFSKLSFDLSGTTPFQKKILQTLLKTKFGQTLTYAELAEKAGYSKASRAVGSVMSSNRLPIFIPCHRVLPSSGGIGNYSCGVEWKKRLLELENANSPAPSLPKKAKEGNLPCKNLKK